MSRLTLFMVSVISGQIALGVFVFLIFKFLVDYQHVLQPLLVLSLPYFIAFRFLSWDPRVEWGGHCPPVPGILSSLGGFISSFFRSFPFLSQPTFDTRGFRGVWDICMSQSASGISVLVSWAKSTLDMWSIGGFSGFSGA